MNFVGGGFGGGLFNRGPDVLDTIGMLLKDVKTDGKKEGYEQAAKEYGQAFLLIEKEYKETKKLFENQTKIHDKRSEQLIVKLENLEMQKKELEDQIKKNTKKVSKKYNIPIKQVEQAAYGDLLGGNSQIDILGIIYKFREMEMKEARQKGYMEAKELYEKKIAKLKKDLQELKEKGDKEVQEYLDIINDLLDTISERQMEIAELKILL